MVATGYYVNVAAKNKDGNKMDVFCILNEPNDVPSCTENSAIASVLEECIKNYSDKETTKQDFIKKTTEKIEELCILCVQFGVQILVKQEENHYENQKPITA